MNKELNPASQLLRPFHLCCAAGIKCTSEVRETPAFRLLEEYFEWMLTYLEHERIDNEFIPFRIDHISGVLKLALLGFARENGIVLNVEVQFSSKFLLGNRMQVLVSLLHMSHCLIDNNRNSDLTIVVDYDPKRSKLLAIFKSQKLDYADFYSPFELEIHQSENLLMEFDCSVIDFQGSEVDGVSISEVEFPYLFNISGGDQSIAEDIFRTILESVKPEVDEMENAFNQENWEILERITHKLKPNFMSVERKDLSTMLQQLEQLAIQQSKDQFKKELDIFLPLAKRALKDLDRYES
ncbi:MAG: hypothetical protein RIC35_20155 [Marinoscillum sp.]